ncbi:MAG: LytTR family transcriptional regulator [Saprospiraceae bacterium]|nr:LytTR family transcriptional regulator [Bacteroidia bacterium]NNE16440.1 LytTR family transcriptional regulator [Saprospiraceae bacterium]NNL93473.1 LytTR family transcriptional regulator [Saprospiraceae bacterium]
MKNQDQKIAIPCASFYAFIKISDIIRCEALQNYTRIFTLGNQEVISSHNIGKYTQLLEEFSFINCHKSHLVNKSLINRYHKEGFVEMCDNSKIPVARRKKNEFIEQVVHGLTPARG